MHHNNNHHHHRQTNNGHMMPGAYHTMPHCAARQPQYDPRYHHGNGNGQGCTVPHGQQQQYHQGHPQYSQTMSHRPPARNRPGIPAHFIKGYEDEVDRKLQMNVASSVAPYFVETKKIDVASSLINVKESRSNQKVCTCDKLQRSKMAAPEIKMATSDFKMAATESKMAATSRDLLSATACTCFECAFLHDSAARRGLQSATTAAPTKLHEQSSM